MGINLSEETISIIIVVSLIFSATILSLMSTFIYFYKNDDDTEYHIELLKMKSISKLLLPIEVENEETRLEIDTEGDEEFVESIPSDNNSLQESHTEPLIHSSDNANYSIIEDVKDGNTFSDEDSSNQKQSTNDDQTDPINNNDDTISIYTIENEPIEPLPVIESYDLTGSEEINIAVENERDNTTGTYIDDEPVEKSYSNEVDYNAIFLKESKSYEDIAINNNTFVKSDSDDQNEENLFHI